MMTTAAGLAGLLMTFWLPTVLAKAVVAPAEFVDTFTCTCLPIAHSSVIWISFGILIFVFGLTVASFVGYYIGYSTQSAVRYPTMQTTSHAPISSSSLPVITHTATNAGIALHPNMPTTRSQAKKVQFATNKFDDDDDGDNNNNDDDEEDSPFDRYSLNKATRARDY
jgi:hypothetical protein